MSSTKLDPVDVVALGHVLTHAQQVGLPMPLDVVAGISVGSLGGKGAVRFDMANHADLTEWAIYLDACISDEELSANVTHYSVEGEALELPVRLITTEYDPVVRELVETQPVPYLVVDEQSAGADL